MQNLLLLHGALGAKNQFDALAQKLGSHFIVHTLNFSAHGGAPVPEGNLSVELFAEEVLQYMDGHNLLQTNIFGYSMGGYVAMYMAKQHPRRINKLVTLATKFYWDEAVAAKEIKMLDAAAIEIKLPLFAAQLAQRHAPNNWKLLLQKTAEMMVALGFKNTLGISDYAGINTPSLIMLGDRDKMVSLEETVNVYKNLPNAQMCMLPKTPHPLEQADTGMLAFILQNFLA